jgi:integrase
MSKFSLNTREQRKKLQPRDDPYYQPVEKGISIGYRKGVLHSTWSLRRFIKSQEPGKHGKYVKRDIGQADDLAPADGISFFTYHDVAKLAHTEPAQVAAFAAKYNVTQCVEDYLTHRRAGGRSAISIHNDSLTLARFLKKFGTAQVSDLTTAGLKPWRDGLVKHPPADTGLTEAQRRDKLRASQGTVNRIWNTVRAALNLAFNSGMVSADLAWRRIKPFEGADQARTRFLSVAECNIFLGACPADPPNFRNLSQATLFTGLRPGELSRLTAGELHGTRLEVSIGKGKLRFVPLTLAGQVFFKKLAKGRAPGDLMLPNPEGAAWAPMQIRRALKPVLKAAKLKTRAVFYDLRRTYGSLLANAGAREAIIATALGHKDTRMTRRHYAHLLDSVVAAELQSRLPKFNARRTRKNKTANIV